MKTNFTAIVREALEAEFGHVLDEAVIYKAATAIEDRVLAAQRGGWRVSTADRGLLIRPFDTTVYPRPLAHEPTPVYEEAVWETYFSNIAHTLLYTDPLADLWDL